MGQCGLPAARSSDHGQCLSFFQSETYVLQGLNARFGIGEIHILEFDPIAKGLFSRSSCIDLWMSVEEFVDAFLRSLCPLNNGTHPANGCHGPGEQIDIEHEFSDVPGGDPSCDGLDTSNVYGDQSAQSDQKEHGREKERIDPEESFIHILVGVGQS